MLSAVLFRCALARALFAQYRLCREGERFRERRSSHVKLP